MLFGEKEDSFRVGLAKHATSKIEKGWIKEAIPVGREPNVQLEEDMALLRSLEVKESDEYNREIGSIFDRMSSMLSNSNVSTKMLFTSEMGGVRLHCLDAGDKSLDVKEVERKDPYAIVTEYAEQSMKNEEFVVDSYDINIDGRRVSEFAVSIVAIPDRFEDITNGKGCIFTPIGDIPFTAYKHQIPEKMLVVPFASLVDGPVHLRPLFFIGPEEKFKFSRIDSFIDRRKVYKTVMKTINDATPELRIGISDDKDDYMDIPRGLFTVGFCRRFGRLVYSDDDVVKQIKGHFNEGDSYLLNIKSKNHISAVAVKYPGYSMEVSTNMYLVSSDKVISFRSGRGDRVRFKSVFQVFDEGLDTSLPLSVPSMFGKSMFTQGFIDGSVDIIYSDKCMRPVPWSLSDEMSKIVAQCISLGVTHDHFIPSGNKMVSRLKHILNPIRYPSNTYCGNVKLISSLLAPGVKVINVEDQYQIARHENMVEDLYRGERIQIGSCGTFRKATTYLDLQFKVAVRLKDNEIFNRVVSLVRTHASLCLTDLMRLVCANWDDARLVLREMLVKKVIFHNSDTHMFEYGWDNKKASIWEEI